MGLDSKTASRYLGVFEQMYLLKRVEVWTMNRLKRIIKTPKMQFIDSDVLAALLNLGSAEVRQDQSRFGAILKTFVYGELLKHSSAAAGDYRLLYYRDIDRFEVDVVIENAAGKTWPTSKPWAS